MKKLYGIRSKIIHGEEWGQNLRRRNIPQLLGLSADTINRDLARAVHKKQSDFINKSVIKIINLKIDEFNKNNRYEIMSNFTDLYFLFNSSLFQNDEDQDF